MSRRGQTVGLYIAALCALGAGSPAALGSAAGDLNSATCPNEALVGFSSALPDCRAYERISPSFQNGVGEAGVVAVAPGGQRLIVSSTATFAGAESNTLGPTYEMVRGAQQWETAAISPPAALYPANKFGAASGDLTKSVWALRSPTQSIYSQDLYLRQAGGQFVRIGPMEPPSAEGGSQANGYRLLLGAYAYVGASRDLSHVYFEIVNGRSATAVWPGDTTGPFPSVNGASLYEYVGVGNKRPNLVGVNGEGRVISDCGTYLGAEQSNDTYSAVSEDGSKVFFTADGHSLETCGEGTRAPAVTELYARLNGIESIPISEPRPTDCSQCSTAVQAAAEFQGASADGSKVFFLTEQALLPGDETKNLYEFDFSAPQGHRISRVSGESVTPQVHAGEVLGVSRVSQDGSHVYFVSHRRLTEEPRGGLGGECIAEESPAERTAEEETKEGRCRAKTGKDNLFMFERDSAHPSGRLAFVATLAEGDAQDWGTVDSRPIQTTPTGRYLVLQSGGALTPGVVGEAPQVYAYDAESEELVRISRGQTGFPQGTENADASYALITSQNHSRIQSPVDGNTFLSVAQDGANIMFITPAALTPEAQEASTHGAESVYEYRSQGRLKEGNVFLLSGGQNALSARPQGLTQTGSEAYFAISNPLVPYDEDGKFDIYTARVDGGFEHSESPSCSGEGCLGPIPAQQPQAAPPGSLFTVPTTSPAPVIPVPAEPAKPKSSPPDPLARALRACRHKHQRKARARCEYNVRHRRSHHQAAKHASATNVTRGVTRK